MDPLETFRQEATALLEAVLTKNGITIDPILEDAPEGFGDVAFPCFRLAKVLRKAPKIIAEELSRSCEEVLRASGSLKGGEQGGEHPIASIHPVNGYLNFSFNEGMLIDVTMSTITERPDIYGKGADRNESIILEHTSANPNGPFHVGRARNPIIGDTLGRILSFAGSDVTTEYYVNDMGKQAVTLTWGVENLGEGIMDHVVRAHEMTDAPGELTGRWNNYDTKTDHELVSYYQRASRLMEEDPEVLETINGMLNAYEKGDRTIGEKVQHYCSAVLEGMRHTLGKINVTLDSYAFESKFVYNGDVTRVIEALNTSKVSCEDEGARYLELETFGIHGRGTRFFYTRKGGTSLYTTRDLAYHTEKFHRGDRVIDVLGEDHKLQAQQLAIALGELGIQRRPETVFYAFVSLPDGKMSTRKGRVVFLDQLIEEALELAYQEVSRKRPDLREKEKREISEVVGIGAIRYNIVRVQMEKGISFSWEEALNFEGDSAPFIQYAHARACSILRKAEEAGEGEEPAEDVSDQLTWKYIDPYEVALIRTLAAFPGTVQECAAGLKIHPMAAYLRDCAQLFNQFYRECPVIKATGQARASRLILVEAFRTVVARGLDLLGIEAPEYM